MDFLFFQHPHAGTFADHCAGLFACEPIWVVRTCSLGRYPRWDLDLWFGTLDWKRFPKSLQFSLEFNNIYPKDLHNSSLNFFLLPIRVKGPESLSKSSVFLAFWCARHGGTVTSLTGSVSPGPRISQTLWTAFQKYLWGPVTLFWRLRPLSGNFVTSGDCFDKCCQGRLRRNKPG